MSLPTLAKSICLALDTIFYNNCLLAKSRSWALGALLLGAGGRMLSSVLEKIYVISLVSRHKKNRPVGLFLVCAGLRKKLLGNYFDLQGLAVFNDGEKAINIRVTTGVLARVGSVFGEQL